MAADRARTREELLAATEKLLAPIIARVQAGKLAGAGAIGVAVGNVIANYKTAKHFDITITGTSLTAGRRQAQIGAEAALEVRTRNLYSTGRNSRLGYSSMTMANVTN